MSVLRNEIAQEYAAALQDYLAGGGETPLRHAYELGRRAIAGGVGVLEMVSIHTKSLATIFSETVPLDEVLPKAERASLFFAESLSPFEMVLRGFRDTNASLRNKVEQIQQAERDLHRQHQELLAAHDSVEAERRRYQELFNFAPDAYLVTDLQGDIQEANSPAGFLLRTPQDLLVSQPLSRFVAEERRQSFLDELSKLQAGESEKLEFWRVTLRLADGSSIPASLSLATVRDGDGRPIGLRCLLRDITETNRIEEERAALRVREQVARAQTENARRLKFLGDVSTALGGSLDTASIPNIVALLSVPRCGNYCFVYLLNEASSVHYFAASHAESEAAELAKSLYFRPPPREVPAPVAEVLGAGKSRIFADVSQAWLQPFFENPDSNLPEPVPLAQALVVPLISHIESLGAMVFIRTEPGRSYSSEDQELADELARRCTLFLENTRLYDQVIIERDRAERASRAKEEFVAILSHELRTPLMSILGWTRVLGRQPQITENQVLAKVVRSVEHNAQTITRLVEDCLEIARIAEGKFQLQREVVDLNQIANAAFESTREFAYAKDLKFVTQFSASPIYVFGDKTRLEQVLLNLLGNAIKYTEGSGEISIRLRAANGEAEAQVRDTGSGIDAESIEQIFQPFGQGSNSLASESGLGLGLTIAREIVQLHGGRIWAESAGRGKGSLFSVRLPLAQAPAPEISRLQQAGPIAADLKKLRILFVEDAVDVLNLLRMEMEELGYSVYTASDGEAGLEIAKRELPDVIVSDIKMPRSDGYELIRQVRRIPELASTPAVAMTGFGMKKDVEKALNAGYNAHLCKPVEVEELVSLIRRLTAA